MGRPKSKGSRQVPSRWKPVSFGSMDVEVSSGDVSLGPGSSGSVWWGTAIGEFFKGLGYGDLGRAPQHTDVAWASSLRMGTRI